MESENKKLLNECLNKALNDSIKLDISSCTPEVTKAIEALTKFGDLVEKIDENERQYEVEKRKSFNELADIIGKNISSIADISVNAFLTVGIVYTILEFEKEGVLCTTIGKSIVKGIRLFRR